MFCKKLFSTAFFYAVAALAGGVFAREFTRFHRFEGNTVLFTLHVHLFMMGMLFFLVAGLLEKQFQLSAHPLMRPFCLCYHIGLLLTVAMLAIRGTGEVMGLSLSRQAAAALSGISGLGHIFLSAGLVLFFLILRKRTAR
ncbi:MAG: DUF2871 domain-containing protein [Provencibacterium sp.]|nr:DUF2871 domain-containing protein [Provencibacterium sp.]